MCSCRQKDYKATSCQSLSFEKISDILGSRLILSRKSDSIGIGVTPFFREKFEKVIAKSKLYFQIISKTKMNQIICKMAITERKKFGLWCSSSFKRFFLIMQIGKKKNILQKKFSLSSVFYAFL